MPVSKDCHRVNISIQLEHLTLSCYKGWSVKDHEIFVTVIKSGVEVCRSDAVSGYRVTSKDLLDYTLTWRQLQILEFEVKLKRNKNTGLYEKKKHHIKLFVKRGEANYLASYVIEVAELANRPGDGALDQFKLKCTSNKITACEVVAVFSLSEGTCTIDDPSDMTTNSLTDNNSVVSNGTSCAELQSGDLSEPLDNLLSKVEFVGLDGNPYITEWEKMQIIFVVFGILPDPMIHLQDLVKQMKLISPYVEVVHICQGQLDHEAALWPYLAVQDEYNAVFHDHFAITPESDDDPRPYVCVVNNRLTEYYIINDSDVGRYVEDDNVRHLYNLWSYKHPTSYEESLPRSTSLHGVDQVPRITAIQRPKSNSWADLSPNGPNGHGVSNGHLTLPNRSSKVRSILESKEYKKLEEKFLIKCENNNGLKEKLTQLVNEMRESEASQEEMRIELETAQEKLDATEQCLLECQQENIFYRHQVLLRGNLYLRSGTFKMFRKRWFELEPGYILSFYNGSEKLGSIGISDMTQVNRVSDLEFKISTQFTEYVLSSDSNGETSMWLVGLETLRHLIYKQDI